MRYIVQCERDGRPNNKTLQEGKGDGGEKGEEEGVREGLGT